MVVVLHFSDGLCVGFEVFRNFVYLLEIICLVFNLMETSGTPSTIMHVRSSVLVRLMLMLNCLEYAGW